MAVNDGKSKSQNGERPFDKEAWAQRKKQERADVYALLDEGTERVVCNADDLRNYLDAQARFDN